MYRGLFYRIIGLLLALNVAPAASAQAASSPFVVTSVAEVERANKLVPAERIVSGDMVIYTLQVRNTGPVTIPPPTVVFPVPEHMIYLADSAVGPGIEVSYSVDGGRSFDSPENLQIKEHDGAARARRSRGLHAYPLAVAKRLESQFSRVRAFSCAGEIAGLISS